MPRFKSLRKKRPERKARRVNQKRNPRRSQRTLQHDFCRLDLLEKDFEYEASQEFFDLEHKIAESEERFLKIGTLKLFFVLDN